MGQFVCFNVRRLIDGRSGIYHYKISTFHWSRAPKCIVSVTFLTIIISVGNCLNTIRIGYPLVTWGQVPFPDNHWFTIIVVANYLSRFIGRTLIEIQIYTDQNNLEITPFSWSSRDEIKPTTDSLRRVLIHFVRAPTATLFPRAFFMSSSRANQVARSVEHKN